VKNKLPVYAKVGKENVQTALSLVGYKSELQPAMEYVFGNSFVCKDMDAAKRVTFDERINKKSVTLDGDSFDPAGTLTGGNTSVSVQHYMVYWWHLVLISKVTTCMGDHLWAVIPPW